MFVQDLPRHLVSRVLIVPTVALNSLLQTLLVILCDPVANLLEGNYDFVQRNVGLTKIDYYYLVQLI